MSWYIHNGDSALARELGLRSDWGHNGSVPAFGKVTNGYEDAGTVQLPTGRVKVEICALPAQFYRFTCTHFSEGEGYPESTTTIETGSGSLGENWPIAEKIATGMVEVTR